MPVNLRMKAAEIEFILKHSGAALCISHPTVAAAAAPAANASGCSITTAVFARPTDDGALPRVNQSDPAVILYTAGTTARILDAIMRFLCAMLPLLPALFQFVMAEQARSPQSLKPSKGLRRH